MRKVVILAVLALVSWASASQSWLSTEDAGRLQLSCYNGQPSVLLVTELDVLGDRSVGLQLTEFLDGVLVDELWTWWVWPHGVAGDDVSAFQVKDGKDIFANRLQGNRLYSLVVTVGQETLRWTFDVSGYEQLVCGY